MGAAGETVTVACRLPAGLVLQIYDMVDGFENAPGGARPIKVAQVRAESFKVSGIGFPQRAKPEDRPQMVGGYALTSNIPADFWEKWLADNKDSDCVKNRLIFASTKADGVEGRAKNNAKSVRSGLEPLNPHKIIKDGQRIPADPRIPHMIDPNDAPAA